LADIFEKTIPINRIININTPVLLQDGENDEWIPLHGSKMIYRALKENGVEIEISIYPKMGDAILKHLVLQKLLE